MHTKPITPALLAAAVLTLTACANEDPTAPADNTTDADGQTVTIGTANFPESEIIGQIWAQALRDAGYEVTVKSGIGSREVYLSALEDGSINVVPEYAGNLTQFYGELEQGAEYFASVPEMLPHCQILSLHLPGGAPSGRSLPSPESGWTACGARWSRPASPRRRSRS